jgi:hypothetical protein
MLIAEKYNEYIGSATRKHDFIRNLIGSRRGGAKYRGRPEVLA